MTLLCFSKEDLRRKNPLHFNAWSVDLELVEQKFAVCPFLWGCDLSHYLFLSLLAVSDESSNVLGRIVASLIKIGAHFDLT